MVRSLRESYRTRPDRSIFVPMSGGRRGHPVLLTWRHVPAIRAFPAGQRLNTYLKLHAGETVEVPIKSSAAFNDLDTPQDYERLRQAR